MTLQSACLLLIVSSVIILILVVMLALVTDKLDKRNQEIEELAHKKPEPKREGKQTRNAHGQFTKRGHDR